MASKARAEKMASDAHAERGKIYLDKVCERSKDFVQPNGIRSSNSFASNQSNEPWNGTFRQRNFQMTAQSVQLNHLSFFSQHLIIITCHQMCIGFWEVVAAQCNVQANIDGKRSESLLQTIYRRVLFSHRKYENKQAEGADVEMKEATRCEIYCQSRFPICRRRVFDRICSKFLLERGVRIFMWMGLDFFRSVGCCCAIQSQ